MLNHNVAWSGGTFYRVYHVSRNLIRQGHSVTLLSISKHRRWGFQREVNEGVDIIYTPDLLWGLGRSGWDFWDVFNRIIFLRGQTWDIIHAWDCRPAVILPALYARHQSRKVGGRLIIDWCDWWGRGGTIQERSGWIMRTFFGPIETFFEEAFRTQADGTTVISQPLSKRVQSLGVSANTIHILRQGCDVESIKPGNRAQARQRLGLPFDSALVGYMGRLNRSDASLLFETLRVLFQREADSKVIIIGNHRTYIPDDLRKTGRLIETGFIPEKMLFDYLAACDVLLAPLADTIASRARWPSKVNMFLTAGRAIVITRVGDLAKMIEQENAGMIADCKEDDIVDRTLNLLKRADLRARFEIRARQIAEQKLSWHDLTRQLEDFYLKVLQQTY